MAKEKIKNEELDTELEEEDREDSEEELVENDETEKSPKKETLKLDFDMEPMERLGKEIDFVDDPSEKAIGEFLLQEFEKDNHLKADYKDKKVTLDKIFAFVKKEAEKRVSVKSGAQCVMMSSQEVYGLVIHYVHDGAPAPTKDSSYTLTKEEKKSLQEQAKEEYLAEQKRKLEEAEKKRIEKEKAAKAKALEKEKEEREKSGQISLFEEFGIEV